MCCLSSDRCHGGDILQCQMGNKKALHYIFVLKAEERQELIFK